MISTFIILFITYGAIALFEAPGLILKKHWRDLIIFSTFWLLTFTLSFLLALNFKIPNPQRAINELVTMVLNIFK